MNNTEKEQLINLVSQISSVDVIQVFDEAYGETLESAFIGGLNAKIIVYYHNIFLENFKKYIEKDYVYLLPKFFNVSRNPNNFDILQQLEIYNTALQKKDLGVIEKPLLLILNYQAMFGLLTIQEPNIHSLDNNVLNKLKTELDIYKNKLKNQLDEISQKNQAIGEMRDKINSFYESKISEYQTLTNNNIEATNILQHINDVNAQASILNEKINNILSNQEKLLVDSMQRFDSLAEAQQDLTRNEKEEYDMRKSVLDDYVHDIDAKNEEYTEKLNFIKENKQFIEEKKAEIIELTGHAADASLGHTFRSRRDELQKSVLVWAGAIILVSILSICWVVGVFFWFSDAYDPKWLNVLINVLKTSPAFILLGFCISQYNKERFLQEEYAFKAAVSMTITAYVDKLNDPKTKEDMLVESTQKVYQNPNTIQSKKGSPFISFGSKELTRTLKDISESIKNIKG